MKTALRILGVAGLTMFGAVAGANAAVMTFTNQANWEAALAGTNILTENFDGAASSFAANSVGNPAGLVTVDVIGHVGDSSNQGLTGTGFFEGEVDGNGSDAASLNFNRSNIFGFALLGLQDNSASSPGGLDLEEIGIEVAGEMFLVSDILGLTDPGNPGTVPTTENTDPIPFIGFVVDIPIDSFLFKHGDLVRPVTGDFENFFLDGLLLAQADVPEPGMLGLLGLGLAGFGLYRRRR